MENSVLFKEKIAPHVQQLWQDDTFRGVQDAAIAADRILQTTPYFADKVTTILENDYVPNVMDILMIRYRTTGVIEMDTTSKYLRYLLYEVGGARAERKKWMHCFEGLDAVIFVASLAAYSRMMFEDESTNQMLDSLELFEQICKLEHLKDIPIFLLLNKLDVFEEQIQKYPLTALFSDAPRGSVDARNYIRDKYLEYGRRGNAEKEIAVYFINATDRNDVDRVVNAVDLKLLGL